MVRGSWLVVSGPWFVAIISYGLVKKAAFAYTILKRLYLIFLLHIKERYLMKKYDVIVIGTGAANIVTDAALAQGL